MAYQGYISDMIWHTFQCLTSCANWTPKTHPSYWSQSPSQWGSSLSRVALEDLQGVSGTEWSRRLGDEASCAGALNVQGLITLRNLITSEKYVCVLKETFTWTFRAVISVRGDRRISCRCLWHAQKPWPRSHCRNLRSRSVSRKCVSLSYPDLEIPGGLMTMRGTRAHGWQLLRIWHTRSKPHQTHWQSSDNTSEIL